MVDRMSLFAGLIGLMIASGATAKDSLYPSRPPAFQKVVDCRSIADQGARLACYDRAVAALDAAEQAKELVVIDKEQVRQARHSLFGLPLPNFHLFGGDSDHDSNPVVQIESKVASASPTADGWRIRLEDGSVWVQTDGSPIFRAPQPGLPVVVKRGALGSYTLRVGNSPGVKVKRVI